MTQEEQELCTSMNIFYCGLHLLVAMADVTENALKKIESTYHDGKDVGSATFPELRKDSTSMKVALLDYCEQLAKHCL